MLLILSSREKIKSLISVSVQNVAKPQLHSARKYNKKYLKKKPFVAGVGINQEKWANFVVADALAPRIASSFVALVLTK